MKKLLLLLISTLFLLQMGNAQTCKNLAPASDGWQLIATAPHVPGTIVRMREGNWPPQKFDLFVWSNQRRKMDAQGHITVTTAERYRWADVSVQNASTADAKHEKEEHECLFWRPLR